MLQLEDLTYPVVEEKLFLVDAKARTVTETDPEVIVYCNIAEHKHSLFAYDSYCGVDGKVKYEFYLCNVDSNGTKFYCHITKGKWVLHAVMPKELLVFVLQN